MSMYDPHLGEGYAKLKAELAAARANLTALRERMRWIPVGERLPDEYEDVIVAVRDSTGKAHSTYAYRLDVDGETQWIANEHSLNSAGNVTHWQPLPAAPDQQPSQSDR